MSTRMISSTKFFFAKKERALVWCPLIPCLQPIRARDLKFQSPSHKSCKPYGKKLNLEERGKLEKY